MMNSRNSNFKSDIFRIYAGYVQNERGNGGIEIVYEIDCRGEKEKTVQKTNGKIRSLPWNG